MSSKDHQIAVLEDRIAELEELLGVSVSWTDQYRRLGLPPLARLMLGHIVKRETVTRESLFTTVYGGRAECDQPDAKNAIGVRVWNIRNTLEPHGIKIQTVYRAGWRMSAADKEKLAVLVASLADDLEPRYRKKQSEEERRR